MGNKNLMSVIGLLVPSLLVVRKNTAHFKLALPHPGSWLLVLGSIGLLSVVSY